MAAIFAHQIGLLAGPADIALGIAADGNCPSVLAGLEAAERLGMLTIALAGGGDGAIAASPAVDHVLSPAPTTPGSSRKSRSPRTTCCGSSCTCSSSSPACSAPGVIA